MGNVTSAMFIPAAALLEHWQGHRRLTRRVIEAFPADRLFSYSIGNMRPFGAMANGDDRHKSICERMGVEPPPFYERT